MDIDKIKSLVAGLADLLEGRRLEEIEVQEGELRLRLRRGGSVSIAPLPAAASNPAPAPAGATPAVPAASEPAESLFVIKSPIVGTFYGAPSPGAADFVKVGDQVEVGQVLCIIEAMKLMNEIEAEVAGEVVRKMATNGQPVEFGEPLFEIRPRK
ncbi:MAG TPA: acetyl-CoA carboxylase biotin carboxyl carrier protein [Terriglobales bacterium]|nr:acetyl-CoA carboxylase biotin carboxyl carrier protein [Terriglobales bacterium]